MYRCECTLYCSSLFGSGDSSSLSLRSPLLWTDTRRNKYQFYILFLLIFSFNLPKHLLLLFLLVRYPYVFGQGQNLIYIITLSRTRLDLCNFYGPSVRISARYKTPNPPCSSSFRLLVLPRVSGDTPLTYPAH
uniref:(northern house mosquito) hypothetical protein n=1 Tax=Culex pipiens TaxID=7175 RepID=A0A8D8EVD5_CULPI